MAGARVVILSGRSLFVEGVANRLRQHLTEQDVHTVDARQADALAQVLAIQPTSVILDATDADVTQHCPLDELLNALPRLRLIRLDPQQDQMQVVTSQQRPVGRVSELIEVITAPSLPSNTDSAHKEEGGATPAST
jgi:hypothetical protein